jgi:hypothetical protein
MRSSSQPPPPPVHGERRLSVQGSGTHSRPSSIRLSSASGSAQKNVGFNDARGTQPSSIAGAAAASAFARSGVAAAGGGGGGGGPLRSAPDPRSWLEIRDASHQMIASASRNVAWVGSVSRELGEAIKSVQAENSVMEDILSEPHHIVSNNDLAVIMKSMLASAADTRSSSIMRSRKPPVLRSLMRARGERLPPDRSGTEYLPMASSAVPYAALQQEQQDMIRLNAERRAAYERMVHDVERHQLALQERWGSIVQS